MSGARICYIVPGFCADENDWCIPVLRNFIERMARRHNVVIYTPHYPFKRSTYRAFGATVHCLSNRKESGARRLMLWEELRRRITWDHAAAPFDLVHAFWATESGYLATAIARSLGIPSIVSIGGGELAKFPLEGYGSQLSALQRHFVRRSFMRARAITAGSAWVANKVPVRYHAKLHTIPLGVDITRFGQGELRRGEDSRRLLAASSFIKLKDYPTLLRAFAIAREHRQELELEIAGDGVERPAIERLLRELRIDDRVRLLGNVPHDEMPGLYRGADLFLHSSLYESQGMAILEALATGLPVVASNVGIAAELPPELVYRFEPRDAEGMADAILRSIATNAHSRAAINDGPSLVRERYSVESQCAIFDGLYHELMTRNSEVRIQNSE